MDFESPDVEKDFPGLYASETGRKSNESDFSDGGDHEKPSKKDLLGRRKEKKEKKDRGYAALEGESSPEEDTDTKSPSKSKKTKSFKFPTKSKEKREKSRDKEKVVEDVVKHKEHHDKDKKKEKEREKEKKEKEKREKLREKDKEKEEKAKFKLESKEKLKDEKKEKVKEKDKDKVKEKDKEKVKEKDKDKKEKKLIKMPSTVTSGIPFEEIFTLGVALPIFGVPLHQSVERSRCHDDTGLPLVVRDSIDYLQAHGIKTNQIYRSEADKIKLQQLKKLYTDRGTTFPYHWDVAIACSILKTFISELPESILTQELHGQFEQATAIAEPQREVTITSLLKKLPTCNHTMLAWLIRHFHSVIAHESVNHVNIQVIATVMGPALNMSLNLLAYLITKAELFFADVDLSRYVPPLQSIPPDFPSSASSLSKELRKQESLLSQIHAEMHAGFITPARDHQLWEAQRIVTQLKRKLRSVQKSVEPIQQPQQQSIDEKPEEEQTPAPVQNMEKSPQPTSEDSKTPNPEIPETKARESPKIIEKVFTDDAFEDNFDFNTKTEAKVEAKQKPKLSEKEIKLLRLQLENAEYLQLKSLLQAKINSEQFEIVKLRSHLALKHKQEGNLAVSKENKDVQTQEEQEVKEKLTSENALMEAIIGNVSNKIFQERVACIQLKIELAMKEIL